MASSEIEAVQALTIEKAESNFQFTVYEEIAFRFPAVNGTDKVHCSISCLHGSTTNTHGISAPSWLGRPAREKEENLLGVNQISSTKLSHRRGKSEADTQCTPPDC